jgi:DegV family protein with EDD domain
MGSVRVVTDSTADLGAAAAEHDITVVPLTVSFGDQTYLDGVTIDSATFFSRLAQERERPTTSQPSPDLIARTYRRLLDEGAAGIVSVHVSSRLSGTCDSARHTADLLHAEGIAAPIAVVDSRQASLGMYFGVLAAARCAASGGDTEAVAEAAIDACTRTHVFLVADDLEYLRRGGRIGQAQRVLGTLLSVKPVITLQDGAVVALESPRTRRRAYERLAEWVRDLAPVEGVVVGQSSPELGDQLEAAVRHYYDGPLYRIWAGPTIGTHVGPGAAGLSVLRAAR